MGAAQSAPLSQHEEAAAAFLLSQQQQQHPQAMLADGAYPGIPLASAPLNYGVQQPLLPLQPMHQASHRHAGGLHPLCSMTLRSLLFSQAHASPGQSRPTAALGKSQA
jgi:hypothetical protein